MMFILLLKKVFLLKLNQLKIDTLLHDDLFLMEYHFFKYLNEYLVIKDTSSQYPIEENWNVFIDSLN